MMEIGRHARVVGDQRAVLTRELSTKYAGGASIRALAEDYGRSYGFIHTLVLESGIDLRARGGVHASKAHVDVLIAALEAQHTVDQHMIAHLEDVGILDRGKIANLETALVSARRIGAAVGIIMAIQKVTQEQAFSVLCEASQNRNRKLRDVADDVLLTGTIE